jgi:hypothetical protein
MVDQSIRMACAQLLRKSVCMGLSTIKLIGPSPSLALLNSLASEALRLEEDKHLHMTKAPVWETGGVSNLPMLF